jgi:hypothetical protein
MWPVAYLVAVKAAVLPGGFFLADFFFVVFLDEGFLRGFALSWLAAEMKWPSPA